MALWLNFITRKGYPLAFFYGDYLWYFKENNQ